MIRRAFLIALLVAMPLAAETMPGSRSWRVTLAVHAGEDSAAVAKRLAAMYRGELETPVDPNGSFLMSLTDAAAAVLAADANVESVQPAAAVPMPPAPAAVAAVRTPQVIAHGSTSWALGPYSYDGTGNIASINTDRYVYDSTNRLVSGAAGGKTETYSYDEFGNIQSITTSGSPTRWLGVDPASNRMDQTTGIINNQSVTFDVTAGYDANGNVSSSGLDWFEYDGLNVLRKSRIGGRWRSYVYTASDERIAVIERVDQFGAETRSDWTLRDPSGQVLRRISREAGQWEWDQDYIYRDSQMLASEVPGPAKRYHYHLDHLGTPRLITGNGGVEVSRHTYLPFGTEVGATPGQNTPEGEWKKFTGHERDHGSLDYMHARYYNPFIGRFLSVDPVMAPEEYLPEPQRWNRYAYATNNPLKNVDPDGKRTRVFIVSSGGDLFSRQGHAALYVETPRGNAGVSLGTTVDFSQGVQGFIDEYNAQGRTVTAYDMKVSPQSEEAIRSFINSDPAAGTDSNKNIQARMMLAENCATGVCNALAAGGVGTNTPGKRAATSFFGTERPFTLQNNLERGPLSVFVGQRVVFAPGQPPSQPQQVPGPPKKMEEPKLCVFCSIQ